MIVHAVLLLFEDFRCGTQVLPGGAEHEYRVKIAGEFSRLSDVDLHRMFDLLPSTPRIVLGRLLLEDVRANAPFVLLADEPIPSRGMAAIRLRLNEHEATILRVLGSLSDGEREALHAEAGTGDPLLRNVRHSVLRKIVEASRGSVVHETFDDFEFQVLSTYAEEAEPFDHGGGRLTLGEIEDEHLYWMCFYLSDNLLLRKYFEFKLWRRLRQEWAGFVSWRGRLVGEMTKWIVEDERVTRGTQRVEGETTGGAKLIKALREECRQVVDDTPLLFVAATKIPPTIRDVVLRNRVREAPIRFYNERRERNVAAEPIERYGPPSYHIRLAAPASLSEGARLEIQRIWREEVESWGWLAQRLLGEREA